MNKENNVRDKAMQACLLWEMGLTHFIGEAKVVCGSKLCSPFVCGLFE